MVWLDYHQSSHLPILPFPITSQTPNSNSMLGGPSHSLAPPRSTVKLNITMTTNAAMTYDTTYTNEISLSAPAQRQPNHSARSQQLIASRSANPPRVPSSLAVHPFSSDTMRVRRSRGSSATPVSPCWELRWMKER